MRRTAAWPLVVAVILVSAIPRSTPASVSKSQEVRARVFRLLTDGIRAYKEGRPKDAIPLLEEAAGIALNSFRAYYYLGLAYKSDRQYKKSIEPLAVALELDPVNLSARVALGDCYLNRGDPTEALAEYHRALRLQEDFAPAYDALGRAAESSGDDEKAIEYFRRAIELNPGFPNPSLNLGDLYMRDGRYDEAIKLFLDAIKVRPDFAAAYNRLGVAYAKQKLGNEAIAALRRAQTLEQGNPWHSVTIGRVFLDLDNEVQAAREFDKALDLDPDYLEAYLAKATLLRRQGKLDQALAVLDDGLRREVEAPRERAELAEYRDKIEAESARQAELENILRQQDGSDVTDLMALAELKADQGDHAGAARLLKDAVGRSAESDPDSDLVDLLAYNALVARMYEDARQAYETLVRRNPNDPALWINLALARIGLADHAGAEEALREASRLRPGDALPLAYLGNVYVLSGRPAEAIASLDASLALM
ncbi:MAG: tetratricopeptide repeat protein, partial [Acidobacteriota bacterium]